MSELLSKRFDEPDEVVSLPNMTAQVVVLGEVYVGRFVHQPGWRWSKDVKPTIGTPSCQHHHRGVVLSGRLHLTTDSGAQRTVGPGEAFDIPPGHDAYVVGDEPYVSVEFGGVRDFGKPTSAGERVLTTLLFTDIVGSTALAAKLGDAAWKTLLGRHFDRARQELDRFRGYEIATTGDGLLATFDGAARAVRCAAAMCRSTSEDGIEIRAGVHSGEVERYTESVRGVAVHVAARVAALAGAGEVLLSGTTAALIEGSGLSTAGAGEHELKGLAGRRQLYRLTGDNPAT
jgi:class 3 adenylate cyclase/mannose-6-phosphate isomerase-like protein (cupin superfamily)